MEQLLCYRQLSSLGFRLSYFGGTDPDGGFGSVSIDSRTVRKGGLFVALKGNAADGHDFVEDAFRSGAAAALVSAERAGPAIERAAGEAGGALVLVEDTLRALQDMAAAYVARFPSLLRVGITGSSGKTTVKEIAAAMIGAERVTLCNAGNLNSETGLPLSVFALRPDHEVGIFEMGMNRPGEIEELARVLKPHIALITNAGSAHIEMFGTVSAIVEEKKRIFSQFTGTETAIVPEPEDEDYREGFAGGVRGDLRYYGPRHLEGLGPLRDRGLEGTEITLGGVPVLFGLPGRHNLKNAFAAAAIARAAGTGDAAIRKGLAAVRPLFGRGEILRLSCVSGGEATVLRDCYNSNPASASAALAFCEGLDWRGRRVYVLGSMLELGDHSVPAHEELGRGLAASRADMVFFYGRETEAAWKIFRSLRNSVREGSGGGAFFPDSIEDLSRALADFVRAGDLVLLKGSRGCALERLVALSFRDDSLDGGVGP